MYIFSFSSSFTFLLNRSYAFQCSSTPCAIHSAAPNIFQLSRAQSFFSFPLSYMQLSFFISFSSLLKWMFLWWSLSPPLWCPSFHPPHSHTVAWDERRNTLSSSLHKWREEGGQNWRGGGGDVGGGLPGQIHFQSSIFSFVFLLLFRRKKKGEEKQKKGKACSCSHSHTEKRPRWSSLIKGIFHERLASLSTMLRCLTRQPPPQQTTAATGRFVYLPGGKSIAPPSKHYPKWASNGTHL